MGWIWRFKWRWRRFGVWRWWWLNQRTPTLSWRQIAKTSSTLTTFFFKIRMGLKWTYTFLQRFMQQSQFWQKIFSENKNGAKRDHRMCKVPPKTVPKMAKAFFKKQETPFWGLLHAVSALFCIMVTILHIFISNYLRPYMLSRKWLQKSSANYLVPARFCWKVFRHIDFWTFFLSISQNFFESWTLK